VPEGFQGREGERLTGVRVPDDRRERVDVGDERRLEVAGGHVVDGDAAGEATERREDDQRGSTVLIVADEIAGPPAVLDLDGRVVVADDVAPDLGLGLDVAVADDGVADAVLAADFAVPDRLEHLVVVSLQGDGFDVALAHHVHDAFQRARDRKRDGVEGVEEVPGDDDRRRLDGVEEGSESLAHVAAVADRQFDPGCLGLAKVEIGEDENVVDQHGAVPERQAGRRREVVHGLSPFATGKTLSADGR